MGRKAGVSPEETRATVLAAAARVFARKGYEGASVADITAEAGLSRGAIYGHFENKADLFAAMLRAHIDADMTRDLEPDRPFDVTDFVARRGSALDRRPTAERTLLIEAVMAAKNDDTVHRLLSEIFTESHERFADVLRQAQRDGLITDEVAPSALARLISMIAMGSLVIGVLDLPAPDHQEWAQLIEWLVDQTRTTRTGPRRERRPAAAATTARTPARPRAKSERPGGTRTAGRAAGSDGGTAGRRAGTA